MPRFAIVVFLLMLLCCTSVSSAEDGIDLSPLMPKGLQGITLNGLYYLSYTSGEEGGEEVSNFFINRAYFTVKKDLFPYLGARITFDTNQDGEGDGEGDMEVRLKYAFADFKFGTFGPFYKTHMEFGIVHAVWLDFEEHINRYRMINPMFVERSGIFNSADFGMTLSGDFGPQLDKEYKEKVADKYAGRYGSFALGFYNGGGYHAKEVNTNKVDEARITLRPLPGIIPGFQASYLIMYGRGNVAGETDDIPLWQVNAGFLSYQHQYGTITAQYVNGWGNQKGSWIYSGLPASSKPFEGYSAFVEGKLTEHWRIVGSYDYFDVDPETESGRFNRMGGGIGYDFGHHNVLIVDYDAIDYSDDTQEDDYWIKLTMQIHY